MATLCICRDVPDSAPLREREKAAHFTYIESIMDQLLVAGPLRPDPARDWNGSLFVYRTDQRSTALDLLHGDPYWKAGIYAKVDTSTFLPAAGAWLGGGIWNLSEENAP